MFTGIIEEIGIIKNIHNINGSLKIAIQATTVLKDIKLGDSITVNGVCLTVSDFSSNYFSCDVMPETISKTNLINLKCTEHVNLERALKVSDRFGGHIVTGHIDGTGSIVNKKEDGNALRLAINTSNNILKYIVEKGSVAVDGVSLTVTYIDEKCFKVSLIPTTIDITTFGNKNINDTVNIECDILGKYVEKLIYYNNRKSESGNKETISFSFLKEHGFT